MAGRSDGSAIKALFSPNKGDPPHPRKKKRNHPPPKMPLPLTKKKNLHKKNYPPLTKMSLPPTNHWLKMPQKKKKRNKKIVGQPPPKIQVDVDDLLQRAKAISSEVEEVRQDQKKKKKERCLSLLWINDHARS